MGEGGAKSGAGSDNTEYMSARDARAADFRIQAALDAYGPLAAGSLGNCCDRSQSKRDLSGVINFSPDGSGQFVSFGNRKSLAAAFGDMLASAGYDRLFSARAAAADEPSDRREERRRQRDERREHRRENLKKLFDGVDLGALTGMLKDLKLSPEIQKAIQQAPDLLKGLQQAPELLKGLQTFMQAIQGVESVKFNKTDDGKLGVTITRKDDNKIPINKEQPGPPKVMVKDATIGKEVSFTIGKDGDNFKLDGIKGITINSTVDLPKGLGGPKDVAVDLKSATLDKDKDGKSVIKATITNPLLPGTTMPVVVPLSLETNK